MERVFSSPGLLVCNDGKYPCHLTLWKTGDQSWAGTIRHINLAAMLTLGQLYPVCAFMIGELHQQNGQDFWQYIEGLEINLEDFSHDSVGVVMSSEPVITLIPIKAHG